MARWQRDAVKERHWRRLIGRWQRSGLTIRDFCGAEDLAEHNFHAWRRALAERDGVARSTASSRQRRSRRSSPPAFLPIHILAEPPACHTELELLLCSGRVIRIRPGFDPATLRALITTLEAIPDAAVEERPC